MIPLIVSMWLMGWIKGWVCLVLCAVGLGDVPAQVRQVREATHTLRTLRLRRSCRDPGCDFCRNLRRRGRP